MFSLAYSSDSVFVVLGKLETLDAVVRTQGYRCDDDNIQRFKEQFSRVVEPDDNLV